MGEQAVALKRILIILVLITVCSAASYADSNLVTVGIGVLAFRSPEKTL